MTEAGYALESPRLSALARPRERRRLATSALIWAFVAGNAAVMVWLWVHGGNLSDDLSTGALLTSLARITGLLGAYSALLQVLLLARHGILAWGGSVQQACDIADLAEYTAKIAIAHAALPGRRRVLDISVPNVAGMHVYPGDPVPRVDAVRRIQAGDVCNLSLLTMGSHTGTHVDAPYHFLADGPRLGDVPLDRMVGEALVADLRGRPTIDAAALADVELRPGDILLCRTDNSQRWEAAEFQRDFVYLTEDAARLLVARGVRAVGMDYLSIERFGSADFPVHRTLLGAGVFVIEGLDLRQASPGRYTLVCLPLSFPDLDGAPARAILLS